jgi:hypothetical protein
MLIYRKNVHMNRLDIRTPLLVECSVWGGDPILDSQSLDSEHKGFGVRKKERVIEGCRMYPAIPDAPLELRPFCLFFCYYFGHPKVSRVLHGGFVRSRASKVDFTVFWTSSVHAQRETRPFTHVTLFDRRSVVEVTILSLYNESNVFNRKALKPLIAFTSHRSHPSTHKAAPQSRAQCAMRSSNEGPRWPAHTKGRTRS